MPPKRPASDDSLPSGKRSLGDAKPAVVTLSGSIPPALTAAIVNSPKSSGQTIDAIDLSSDQVLLPPNLPGSSPSTPTHSQSSQLKPDSPNSLAKGSAFDKLLGKPPVAHMHSQMSRLHMHHSTFMNNAHHLSCNSGYMHVGHSMPPPYIPQQPQAAGGAGGLLPTTSSSTVPMSGPAAPAAQSVRPSYDDLQRTVLDLQAQIATLQNSLTPVSSLGAPSVVASGQPSTAASSSSTGMHQSYLAFAGQSCLPSLSQVVNHTNTGDPINSSAQNPCNGLPNQRFISGGIHANISTKNHQR